MHTSQGRYVLQCIPQAHRLRDQCVCIRSTCKPCTHRAFDLVGKTAFTCGKAERGRQHWTWSVELTRDVNRKGDEGDQGLGRPEDPLKTREGASRLTLPLQPGHVDLQSQMML